jgi:hypothetical protein
VGGGLGGPIEKDKLWFFTAARAWGASQYQQGSYYNLTQGTLFYTPDPSRLSHNNEYFRDVSLRLTWQAAQKHKIVFSYSQQNNCSCPFGLLGVGGATAIKPAPEALGEHHYNPNVLPLVSWSFPATNRILFEAAVSANILGENSRRLPETGVNDISSPICRPTAWRIQRHQSHLVRQLQPDDASSIPSAVRHVLHYGHTPSRPGSI